MIYHIHIFPFTQVNSMYKQPASVMNGKLMHDYSGKINALQVYYLRGTSAQLTYTAILTESNCSGNCIVVSVSVKFLMIALKWLFVCPHIVLFRQIWIFWRILSENTNQWKRNAENYLPISRIFTNLLRSYNNYYELGTEFMLMKINIVNCEWKFLYPQCLLLCTWGR